MTAVFFIPLRDGRILLHVLNDISPTYAGVVSTERNLTLLGTVGNNAHLGPAEVVVEQVLKPHSSNEQEVPAIGSTFFNVILRTIATDFAIIFAGQAKRFVKLLEKLV